MRRSENEVLITQLMMCEIAKQHKDDMIFGFLNKNFAWFSCPADKVDSIVKFIGVPTDD